jgi:hypothetical protein
MLLGLATTIALFALPAADPFAHDGRAYVDHALRSRVSAYGAVERLRPRRMSAAAFEAYRSRAITQYASAQVSAGEQIESLLPEGADTPGMLPLTAESAQTASSASRW